MEVNRVDFQHTSILRWPQLLGHAAAMRHSALLLLALLGLSLTLASLGCLNTRRQLETADRWTEATTNAIAQVHDVAVRVAPSPTREILDALLGAVATGLTAWNAAQHRRIVRLEGEAEKRKAPRIP